MYKRDLLPPFAGLNTFARAPEGSLETLRMGDVAVVGVTHDGTSSSRQGVRQGPRAIREASVDFTYDLYSSTAKALIHVTTGRILRVPQDLRLRDVGDLPVYPMDLGRTLEVCRRTAAAIVERGAFPVTLGGDHYVTYPLVQGVADALGKKVGLIQLSSALDLAESDLVWGRDWHGATVRRVLENGSVEARNMVFVGTQGYIPIPEWDLAHSLEMTVIPAPLVKTHGARATVERAVAAAGAGSRAIYLSIDVDVVDSGYASGTGEVVVGGLMPAEVLSLARELSDVPNVVALDVVEVAPKLDLRGRSERLAAEAIIELIAPRVFST